MKKYLISGAILAIIIIAIVVINLLIGAKTQDNMVTIRLNEVTHSVFYAPQYVAMANGYFYRRKLKY